MDITLKNKCAQSNQMLLTLEQAINDYKKKCDRLDTNSSDPLTELHYNRDAVIKRLEYCVDGFWKLLKLYLEKEIGLALVDNGPKPIARTAALHHCISEEESARLIKIIEERNKTSHIYREEIADEIAKYAPQALLLMRTILDRLTK